jgi:hypothetical protein
MPRRVLSHREVGLWIARNVPRPAPSVRLNAADWALLLILADLPMTRVDAIRATGWSMAAVHGAAVRLCRLGLCMPPDGKSPRLYALTPKGLRLAKHDPLLVVEPDDDEGGDEGERAQEAAE